MLIVLIQIQNIKSIHDSPQKWIAVCFTCHFRTCQNRRNIVFRSLPHFYRGSKFVLSTCFICLFLVFVLVLLRNFCVRYSYCFVDITVAGTSDVRTCARVCVLTLNKNKTKQFTAFNFYAVLVAMFIYLLIHWFACVVNWIDRKSIFINWNVTKPSSLNIQIYFFANDGQTKRREVSIRNAQNKFIIYDIENDL